MQKPRLGPDALAARDIVHAATTGGAEVLGLGPDIGRLEVGARGSFILLDLEKPHVWPTDNLATAVVYSATASDVVMTVTDGEIRYDDGRVAFLDEEKLGEEVTRERTALEQRAGLRG